MNQSMEDKIQHVQETESGSVRLEGSGGRGKDDVFGKVA